MSDYEIKNGKVFCLGDHMRKADASTFKVLNELFSVDCNNVFVLGNVLQKADPKSFSVFPPYLVWHDNDGEKHFTGSGYGMDATNVFFYEYTVGKGFVVRGADRNTFEVLDFEFARDGSSVYFIGRRVKGAKPRDVRVLNQGYILSNNRIFYGNEVVREADPETFAACEDQLGLGILGKDANQFFDAGHVVSYEEFSENRQ